MLLDQSSIVKNTRKLFRMTRSCKLLHISRHLCSIQKRVSRLQSSSDESAEVSLHIGMQHYLGDAWPASLSIVQVLVQTHLTS